MNREQILESVENLINGKINSLDPKLWEEYDGPIERYMAHTVKCLNHEYKSYASGISGKSDFLGALRLFMMVFQAKIHISDEKLLKNNEFGIFPTGDPLVWFVSPDVPSYFTWPSFVEKAFINSNTSYPKTDNKYSLQTNPFIYNLTGFKMFKSFEQKLCVHGALNTPKGYTTLICMPTGGGKSLVTQSVAYSEKKSLTIVVVPTVSLAIDQAKGAAENIKSSDKNREILAYYAGVENSGQIFEEIKNKSAKILFISPEALLKNEQFKNLIQEAAQNHYLKNVVIDEAHIVVSWGDSFRVDYQCLEAWRKELIKFNPELKTFLLSATFDSRTIKILKSMFKTGKKWIEIRCDALRKEPRFCLISAGNFNDKKKKVLELVNKLPHPMIIYVNSPDTAEYWKSYLFQFGYKNIQTFTGDTPNGVREKLIQGWSDNQFEIMIATSAFGVGVDKPDVRTVLHLYVPEGADTYYQELGRGGRDGLPCLSVMCIIPEHDLEQAGNHVTKVLTTEKLKSRWLTLSSYKNPNNIWQGGKILINTYVKPDENQEGIFEPGNKLHQKWNINALLLLRRYGLLKINEIQFQDPNYFFLISDIDERLNQDGPTLDRLLEEIRDKEQFEAYERLNVLKKHIYQADKNCWSDMFTDTYDRVSLYCAGCEEHENCIDDSYGDFPLLKSITGPRKFISDQAMKYFNAVHEAIYINDRKPVDDLLSLLDRFQCQVIVTDRPIKQVKGLFDWPDLMIINFHELHDLLEKDNHFYISGLIAAIYDTKPERVVRQFNIIRKLIRKQDSYVIHVTEEDLCIGTNQKPLSQWINGARITMNL